MKNIKIIMFVLVCSSSFLLGQSKNIISSFYISNSINNSSSGFDKHFYPALPNSKISNNNFYELNTINFNYIEKDTILKSDSLTKRSPLIWTVTKEMIFGTLMGGFFSLPGGVIGTAMGKGDGAFGTGLIGMYAGYLAGSSLGVYLVAKKDKPNISYWGTLGSGILGGVIGMALLHDSNKNFIGSVAPFVFPLIASIIYAELIE